MKTNNIPYKTHSAWLDAMKIFAAFLVVFQHSTSHVWTAYPIDTFTWKLTHIFFLFSRTAVLLFFMCSGAGMLQKEHSVSQIFSKNIFLLLKIYISWMLIYGIRDCISLFQEGLATPRTCINAVIKNIIFGQYHTWFILALISLYLITPFLFQITRTKENTLYFLLISIIFTIIFPCIRSFGFLSRLADTLDNFHMNFVYGYVLYFIAGYYINTIFWQKIYTYIAVITFFISFSFASIYSMNLSISLNAAQQEVFSEFSPFMFLSVISVFSIFKGLEHRFTYNNIVKTLISYGFAIYLMHPLFLPCVKQLNGIYAFPGALILYLFCIFISFLISKSKVLSKFLLR